MHETEGAEIALALSCGGAGNPFRPEAFGIGTEQHGTNRHAGSLVVPLREGVDRQRLRVDAVKVALGGFLR